MGVLNRYMGLLRSATAIIYRRTYYGHKVKHRNAVRVESVIMVRAYRMPGKRTDL